MCGHGANCVATVAVQPPPGCQLTSPSCRHSLCSHIAKNFLDLPKIKVPLILGIWGGKGQGKTFQCNLAYKKLGACLAALVTRHSAACECLSVHLLTRHACSPAGHHALLPRSDQLHHMPLSHPHPGITPIVMSAGELESGNAGEPAKLIRQR